MRSAIKTQRYEVGGIGFEPSSHCMGNLMRHVVGSPKVMETSAKLCSPPTTPCTVIKMLLVKVML